MPYSRIQPFSLSGFTQTFYEKYLFKINEDPKLTKDLSIEEKFQFFWNYYYRNGSVTPVLNGLIELGLYLSKIKYDCNYLLDAIYTDNKLIYVAFGDLIRKNPSDIFKILYAFTGCCDEIAKQYLLKNNYPDVTTTLIESQIFSLILGIFLGDKEILDNAVKSSREYIRTNFPKKSVYERSWVSFILNVLDKDFESANLNLLKVTKLHHSYPLDISFQSVNYFVPSNLYGTYLLMRYCTTPEEFEKIKIPDHELWIKEYFDLLKKNNYSHGKFIFEPLGELSYLKELDETQYFI